MQALQRRGNAARRCKKRPRLKRPAQRAGGRLTDKARNGTESNGNVDEIYSEECSPSTYRAHRQVSPSHKHKKACRKKRKVVAGKKKHAGEGSLRTVRRAVQW